MKEPAFQPPNYTQSPNDFFDDLLPQITSLTELKVTLVIMRKTFGWLKREDHLALKQLIDLTGLSRQGVLNGIELGMKRGTIERRPFKNSFAYSLSIEGKMVNDLDQSKAEKSVYDIDHSPENGLENRPKLVNDLDLQKKGKKRNKNISVSLPKNFALSTDLEKWSFKTKPNIDLTTCFEKFTDYHKSKGSKFVDWDAAWRTWVRNAVEFDAKRYPSSVPPAKQRPIESPEEKDRRLAAIAARNQRTA